MSRAHLLAPVPAAMAAAAAGPRLTLGHGGIDARLGDGLAQAALHEVFAASEADAPAAAGFALLLALRSTRPGPVLWLREDKARMNGRLYGHGLAELGFDPARLLLVQAPDTLAVLRAGADAVACAAVACVIIEPWGKAAALDLTATRRLALATAKSGVTTLLLRGGAPSPSAAQSRWRVAAAPSRALAADAPGNPAFAVTLLRHRGGIAGFDAHVEWNRDKGEFEQLFNQPFETPVSGASSAIPAQRTGPAPEKRAA